MPLCPSISANEVHMKELEHFCHRGPDPAVTATTRDPTWRAVTEVIFTVGQAPGPCATQVSPTDAFHCWTVFFPDP